MKLEKLEPLIPDHVFLDLNELDGKYEVDTELRVAHFLAQAAHESGNFLHIEENLNYSAQRLREIFPRYFNHDLATQYAHNPQMIASRVYASRMGNGDEASKEGYRYRGRGYIQLTGKDNYGAFAQTVGDDILNNPDLVATKYPLLSAAWFWSTRSLNQLADQGSGDDVVTKITKKVNGGLNGLEVRKKLFYKFYGAIKSE